MFKDQSGQVISTDEVIINPELVETTSDDGKGPYKKKRPSKK